MEKITEELPANIPVFVDVMGGAFNVGANVVAMDSVVYNDYNKRVFEIVKELLTKSANEIILKIEEIISEFNLSKGEKESFLRLRESYNQNPIPEKLFVLHLYSFQNMIRFNNKMQYNVPVGVAGYSDDLKERILKFVPKTEKVDILNLNYKDLDYTAYPKNTVFYFCLLYTSRCV